MSSSKYDPNIQLSTVDFWNALVNHLGPKMLHAIFSSRQHEFLSHYKYFIDLFKDNKTTVKTFSNHERNKNTQWRFKLKNDRVIVRIFPVKDRQPRQKKCEGESL